MTNTPKCEDLYLEDQITDGEIQNMIVLKNGSLPWLTKDKTQNIFDDTIFKIDRSQIKIVDYQLTSQTPKIRFVLFTPEKSTKHFVKFGVIESGGNGKFVCFSMTMIIPKTDVTKTQTNQTVTAIDMHVNMESGAVNFFTNFKHSEHQMHLTNGETSGTLLPFIYTSPNYDIQSEPSTFSCQVDTIEVMVVD